MDMGVLKQFLRDEAISEHILSASMPDTSSGKGSKGTTRAATPMHVEPEKLPKPLSPHRLIMHTIVRYAIFINLVLKISSYTCYYFSVLKHLGCQHGCADGQRGPAAEFLRTQCQNILAKLSRASGRQFKCFLRDYVKYQSLPEVMEFFHSYVGFCIDPSSLLSPLSKLIYNVHTVYIINIVHT